ncbi:unnamed protein product [Linum trigynum]|uniref:TF-B3 domain-containing protein n=1 Tax=Linum trigynum TaxID=586398 RepID=A0AAV2FTP1_9ROSI
MALKKLLIPPEFVSNCGRANLTNPVVLEPTVGDPPQVEVELYEDARGFWLRNGWQEFADRNSLTHGHYLLFEYKSFSRTKRPGSPVAGSGGGQPARPRFAENAKQKAFMATRKGRTADGGQSGKRNQFGKDKAETSHIPAKAETSHIPAKAEHVEGMAEPGRGNTSTSSISPSFFITINQTNMNKCYANLPTGFVFEHMKLEKSTVMVCSEDGSGPWVLSFVLTKSYGGHGRGQGRFSGGWPAFRNDNSLKPGDVCRFKLISRDEMEVTIERN